jgi:3-dehydroquinate synthase
MTSLRTVPVGLDDRSYEVLVGEGALDAAGERLAGLFPRGRALIVTETEIERLHGPRLAAALEAQGVTPVFLTVSGGETGKSWTGLAELSDRLLAENIERKEAIIAFGGGVIGDLAGFSAAVVKRGVDFIQIPTTLLAQVDSSVGGKTGINTAAGKNMAGAFHQPRLVIADSAFLATLPDRERRAGYAEIAKAALIGDAPMFDRLEAAGAKALTGETLTAAIADAVAFKARIVVEDEREAGVRALLNLGHTFGHAFEAEAEKGALVHGEAVAAGMALAFDFSVALGHCPAANAERVREHLRAVGLPDDPKALPGGPYEAARLVERMRSDKKNADGRITLILARGVGDAYIDRDVDEDVLVSFMEQKLK